MSNKVRVYELAKETGLHNKEVLRRLTDLGIDASSHSSSVAGPDAKRFRDSLGKSEAERKAEEEARKAKERAELERYRSMQAAAPPEGKKAAKVLPPHLRGQQDGGASAGAPAAPTATPSRRPRQRHLAAADAPAADAAPAAPPATPPAAGDEGSAPPATPPAKRMPGAPPPRLKPGEVPLRPPSARPAVAPDRHGRFARGASPGGTEPAADRVRPAFDPAAAALRAGTAPASSGSAAGGPRRPAAARWPGWSRRPRRTSPRSRWRPPRTELALPPRSRRGRSASRWWSRRPRWWSRWTRWWPSRPRWQAAQEEAREAVARGAGALAWPDAS